MTDEEAEKAHATFEVLCMKIWKLVDFETEKLTESGEEYARLKLGDEFRFWRIDARKGN